MTFRNVRPCDIALQEEWYLFEGLVNDVWMLEVVIREEVELVQEISNIDAAQWIHL